MGQEKTFENKVKKYIEDSGGWEVKFFANRMTRKGIPDVLACINGYFLGIEIKAQNGYLSDLQIYQITKIRQAGGLAFGLYPSGLEKFIELVKCLKKGNEPDPMSMELILK